MALALLLEAHVLRVMDFLRIKTPGLDSLILGEGSAKAERKNSIHSPPCACTGCCSDLGNQSISNRIEYFGGNV